MSSKRKAAPEEGGSSQSASGSKATKPKRTEPLASALRALRLGISVLPIKLDGTKAPALREWTTFQNRLPTEEQVRSWFTNDRGLGVVCGAVSGGLEMFEFEGRAVEAGLPRRFFAAAKELGYGKLVNRIVNGYSETTPSGGLHLYYRCPEPCTRKLARCQVLHAEGKSEVRPLIETKGEGGFSVIAPTTGAAHYSGNPWVVKTGSIETIVTITAEERDALHRIAASFDELPPKVQSHAPVMHNGDRPGDGFNRDATWSQVLEPHGWVSVVERDGATYWRRPGKSDGLSATTGHGGHDVLYVFTSSTDFEPDTGFEKFTAYAVLNHGSDFRAAARDVHDQGYSGLDELEREITAMFERSDEYHDHLAVALTDDDLRNLPPIEWLIPGWIPAVGVTVAWGEPGVGKTYFTLGISKAVRRGKRWQGRQTQHGAVLFYEGEVVKQIDTRMAAFDFHWPLKRGTQLPQLTVPVTPDLTTVKGLAATVRTALMFGEQVEADGNSLRLIVIDPLAEFTNGDELGDGMLRVSKALRYLAEKTQCAVLVGHHSNAAGERARGNDVLRQKALVMIQLERAPENQLALLQTKNRFGPELAMTLWKTEVQLSENLTELVLEHDQGGVTDYSASDYLRKREDRKEAAKNARQSRKAEQTAERARDAVREAFRRLVASEAEPRFDSEAALARAANGVDALVSDRAARSAASGMVGSELSRGEPGARNAIPYEWIGEQL